MFSHQPLHRPTRRRRTVVVVQCRQTLGDVASRTAGPPPPGQPGLTASCGAKLGQDPPTSSTTSSSSSSSRSQEAHQENLDQTSSVSRVPAASSPAPATPTLMSPGGRWSVSSDQETPTNQNQTLILNPVATPTPCDVISSDAITETGTGTGTRTQTDPVSEAPPTCCPLSERLRPPHTGDGEDEAVGLQRCQQVANELRQTARNAVHLYRQLGEQQTQMASVLREAFDVVHLELQAALRADGRSGGAPAGELEDDRTTSLLEKYSELLVQMTQNKLNRI